jgi:hypothetical protein
LLQNNHARDRRAAAVSKIRGSAKQRLIDHAPATTNQSSTASSKCRLRHSKLLKSWPALGGGTVVLVTATTAQPRTKGYCDNYYDYCVEKWRKTAHDDGLCVSCKSIAQPRTNLRQVEAVLKAAAAAFYAYVFPLT